MNWEEIGAIGQVLGSIAVLITLGYLAIQQRYTRRELQRSISQSRSDAIRELLTSQATDERLTSIILRVDAVAAGRPPTRFELLGQGGITREEEGSWVAFEFAWWNYRSQTIAYIDELNAGERTQFDQSVRSTYGNPGRSRLWYEFHKSATTLTPTLNPDAVRYIDNLLAQSG